MSKRKSIRPKLPNNIKSTPGFVETFNKTKVLDLNSPVPLNPGNFQKVSSSNKLKIANNESIVEMFPDLEISIQILVSSILAPNDMLTNKINLVKPDINIPNTVNSIILEVISSYIKKHYNLTNKIYDILRETIFIKGSYCELIVPENVLNNFIHERGQISLEDYIDKQDKIVYGLIGSNNVVNISTEDLNINTDKNIKEEIVVTENDLLLEVTDNPAILNLANKYVHSVEDEVSSMFDTFDVSNEDYVSYKKTFSKKEKDFTISYLENNEEQSYGKPLVMKLPTTSVIPIYSKNDVSKHIGYFVLLNEKGNPITEDDLYGSDNSTSEVNNGISNIKIRNDYSLNNVISRVKKSLYGLQSPSAKIENMQDVYISLTSKILNNKLKGGKYADIAEFRDDYDLYNLMFTRSLENKKTRVLFVPKDFMVYYAFEYRKNGTGKSLLEKVGMLSSFRAIMLFADIMSKVKNSTVQTEVSAELDENDPDPERTMARIVSETLKTRQAQLPFGALNTNDLVNWAHSVGMRYKFKHPALPDFDINIDDVSTNKESPDTDLMDKIEEFIIMSFGLTAEMVKSGFDPEFATTVIANNILLTKRILRYQAIAEPIITKHVNTLLKFDYNIRETIGNLIKNNISEIKRFIKKVGTEEEAKLLKNDKKLIEYLTKEYCVNITAELPKPEPKEVTNLKDTVENYTETIDTLVDKIFTDESLPEEVFGELGNKMETIKGILKAMLIKNFATENNFIPELSKFFTVDDEGKPVFDVLEEYQTFTDILANSLLPFLKENKKFVDKLDKKVNKIEEGTNDEEDTKDDSTGEEGSEETPPEGEENNEEGDVEGTEVNEEGGEEGDEGEPKEE